MVANLLLDRAAASERARNPHEGVVLMPSFRRSCKLLQSKLIGKENEPIEDQLLSVSLEIIQVTCIAEGPVARDYSQSMRQRTTFLR